MKMILISENLLQEAIDQIEIGIDEIEQSFQGMEDDEPLQDKIDYAYAVADALKELLKEK